MVEQIRTREEKKLNKKKGQKVPIKFRYDSMNFRQKWISLLQEAGGFFSEPNEWRISINNIDLVFNVLQLTNNKKGELFKSSIENFTLRQKKSISFDSFCRAF